MEATLSPKAQSYQGIFNTYLTDPPRVGRGGADKRPPGSKGNREADRVRVQGQDRQTRPLPFGWPIQPTTPRKTPSFSSTGKTNGLGLLETQHHWKRSPGAGSRSRVGKVPDRGDSHSHLPTPTTQWGLWPEGKQDSIREEEMLLPEMASG